MPVSKNLLIKIEAQLKDNYCPSFALGAFNMCDVGIEQNLDLLYLIKTIYNNG